VGPLHDTRVHDFLYNWPCHIEITKEGSLKSSGFRYATKFIHFDPILASAFEIMDKSAKTEVTVKQITKIMTKLMKNKTTKIDMAKIEELRNGERIKIELEL
jgi:hypothetical protein